MKMQSNKLTLASLALCSGLLLTACGGSDSVAPPQMANAATLAAINPTNGPAVVGAVLGQDFRFEAGVPSFGISSPTSLVLAGSGAAPTFAINATEGTAGGTMAFGSCKFLVTSSTFAANMPLAIGNTVTVNPCSLSLETGGAQADGTPRAVDASLKLDALKSSFRALMVAINASGGVSIGNVNIGTTTLVPATGAGS